MGEDNIVGSEQKGKRPVIVISNDTGNKFSPTVEIAVITSKLTKAKLPTHVEIPMKYGLLQDSVILVEQVKTIDKQRLTGFIGNVDSVLLNKLNAAIEVAFAIGNNTDKDKITTIIEDKIFIIHSYEATITTLKENGLLNEVTLNILLQKRQHDLEVLIRFCELNHMNYMDYYKPYGYRESMLNN